MNLQTHSPSRLLRGGVIEQRCVELDELDKAAEICAAAYDAMQWRPISKSPKDGTLVMFYAQGKYYIGRADDYWNKAMYLEKATHYQLLPPPPSGMGE